MSEQWPDPASKDTRRHPGKGVALFRPQMLQRAGGGGGGGGGGDSGGGERCNREDEPCETHARGACGAFAVMLGCDGTLQLLLAAG
jgi:hypothetical protein